jgi:nicotinamide-nucleotide amidase
MTSERSAGPAGDASPSYPAMVEAAVALGRAVQEAGGFVATAESCTGGLVAAALTEIGGSSAWFERGFVTYSNAAKQDLLGVSASTLATHGAVSEPTAREMAAGALRAGRATLALSVTGIAGPSGATPGKPVGTVCFGWASATRIETQTRHFEGDRAAIRMQAALHALRQAMVYVARPDPAERLA